MYFKHKQHLTRYHTTQANALSFAILEALSSNKLPSQALVTVWLLCALTPHCVSTSASLASESVSCLATCPTCGSS